MPHANSRLWTLPLTALLFANTVLVGFAARHVGWAAEPSPAVSEVVVGSEEPQQAAEEFAAGDPPVVTAATSASVASPTEVNTTDVVVDESDGGWIYDEAVAADPDDSTGTRFLPVPPVVNNFADPPLTGVDPALSKQPEPVVSAVEPVTDPLLPAAGGHQPLDLGEFLILVNPPASGGIVHFALDREVTSLAPGEFHLLPAQGERLIQFHRGDDLGDVEKRCQFGMLTFAVNDKGWTLSEVAGPAAERLLKICRPVDAGE